MTCQEVSTLMSSGRARTRPVRQRLGLWLHLALCRHCRAFRGQLALIDQAARRLSLTIAGEPSPAFERSMLTRLQSSSPDRGAPPETAR